MKKTCLPKNQNSSCFRLFSWHTIAFVIVFFNQKHKSLMYRAIKVYYKQTEDLGSGLISKLSNELDAQYSKFEARMKEHKDEDRIRVPTRVFYISVICLVSLFCFFICTFAANIHLLNSGLLWKIFGWSIGMATFGIGMVIVIPKLLERSK